MVLVFCFQVSWVGKTDLRIWPKNALINAASVLPVIARVASSMMGWLPNRVSASNT